MKNHQTYYIISFVLKTMKKHARTKVVNGWGTRTHYGWEIPNEIPMNMNMDNFLFRTP